MAIIKVPNAEYHGQIGDVVFRDGVVETDNAAVIAYCRGAGYEVDGATDNPAALPRVEVDSSRTHTVLGTPLRDAATDPRPDDFLAPVGAGAGDPHGPTVASPQIHASGTTPLVPGPVPDDTNAQQDRESTAARLALIEQAPAGEVVDQLAGAAVPGQPGGNASQEAWADWVIATYPDLDPQTVRAMKRDDLRAKYGTATA